MASILEPDNEKEKIYSSLFFSISSQMSCRYYGAARHRDLVPIGIGGRLDQRQYACGCAKISPSQLRRQQSMELPYLIKLCSCLRRCGSRNDLAYHMWYKMFKEIGESVENNPRVSRSSQSKIEDNEKRV